MQPVGPFYRNHGAEKRAESAVQRFVGIGRAAPKRGVMLAPGKHKFDRIIKKSEKLEWQNYGVDDRIRQKSQAGGNGPPPRFEKITLFDITLRLMDKLLSGGEKIGRHAISSISGRYYGRSGSFV